MIASDDNNPQFVGAHNPDDRLHVRFYVKTLPNAFETEKQGRPIFYEADFVHIHLPGDKNNDIDTFVNDTHKQRFPRQWAHFMNNKKADSEPVIGTPIAEWALVSRSQAEQLRALGFKSVDSIASASDAQLQSIGMIAGMQPYAFRERAQRFLSQANAEAGANADAKRAADAEARANDAEKAIAELRAQMEALQANKAKPGRKPKVTEEA